MDETNIPEQREPEQTTLEAAYEQAAEDGDLEILLAPYHRMPSGCLLFDLWLRQ